MFGRQKFPAPALKVIYPATVRNASAPEGGANALQAIPFSPNWLPFPDAGPSPSADQVAVADADASELKAAPIPVIVAEDDPVSRELVRTLLEKWGYRVVVTNDGREAMEAIRAQVTPALAVIDWMMPGMDGIESASACAKRTRFFILSCSPRAAGRSV
ncbi:MAG: response regulator [Verrucomicrobiota bacterium]|nr:response regulator [Verrucomicrobiota bacterium]